MRAGPAAQVLDTPHLAPTPVVRWRDIEVVRLCVRATGSLMSYRNGGARTAARRRASPGLTG